MKKTNILLTIIAINLTFISLNYLGIWPNKSYANTNFNTEIIDVNIKTIDGYAPVVYPNTVENEKYGINTAWLGVNNGWNNAVHINNDITYDLERELKKINNELVKLYKLIDRKLTN